MLEMVVAGLVGMPAPVMGCPTITPVRLVTFVIILLPEVTVPLGVTVLLAVAFADITTVVPLGADLMVVPTGMPGPVRGCPTANPAMLDTRVMFALPEVTMPLNEVWVENGLEAVAFADIVILAPMVVMVVGVAVGMSPEAAVMGCPVA